MKITEKDVKRRVVDRRGCELVIVDFNADEPYPVTARSGGVARVFKSNGRLVRDTVEDNNDLIRFADEPESKPPPETVEVWFDSPSGLAFILTAPKRPDLAGQTFTYRLEKK